MENYINEVVDLWNLPTCDDCHQRVVDLIPEDLFFDVMIGALKKIRREEKKLYFYLVTFTLKPSVNNTDDKIGLYIRKQFEERPPLQIIEAYMVEEKTQNNIPHWHVAVSTNKPLKKDRFNYYIKKYGNIDISKTKAQTLLESINYISKEAIPTKLAVRNL